MPAWQVVQGWPVHVVCGGRPASLRRDLRQVRGNVVALVLVRHLCAMRSRLAMRHGGVVQCGRLHQLLVRRQQSLRHLVCYLLRGDSGLQRRGVRVCPKLSDERQLLRNGRLV